MKVRKTKHGERVETDSGAEVARSIDLPGIVMIGGVAYSRGILEELLPLIERWVKTGSFDADH